MHYIGNKRETMKSTPTDLFLSLFCKELSFHIDSARTRKEKVTPLEFVELVSIASKEVLDQYLDQNFDTGDYHLDVHNSYEDIARLSIDSYTQSNQVFEKITDEHATLLEEHKDSDFINVNKLSEKFSDIQSHLINEIIRANTIIKELNLQVQHLEIASTLDPLTKTYNRHALQKHLKELLSREKRSNDLFIFMLDIDNFKIINDTYGHIAGDKILIFIAKLLKKALRDGDKVYRFGGEEFLILVNRTDLPGTELIANRLLTLCRQNKPLFHNEQISVTVSLGLTQVRDKDTMDTLIQRADTALYRAKKNGKDRYEMEL